MILLHDHKQGHISDVISEAHHGTAKLFGNGHKSCLADMPRQSRVMLRVFAHFPPTSCSEQSTMDH